MFTDGRRTPSDDNSSPDPKYGTINLIVFSSDFEILYMFIYIKKKLNLIKITFL
jgi:hypothetical protein